MLEVVLCVVGCLLPLGPAGQQDCSPDDLLVGHWVRVKGVSEESGMLLAQKLEIQAPESRNEVIGTVSAVTEDEDAYAVVTIEGQPCFVTAKSRLRGVDVAGLMDLEGARVSVEGYWRSPSKFSVRELELRSKGRDRLVGRIDRIAAEDGRLTVSIMGRDVLLGTETEMESDGVPERMPLAEAVEMRGPLDLGRRVDDDDDIEGRRVGNNLWVGARLEWRQSRENEFDLDRTRARDRTDDDYSVRGELRWVPTDRMFGLLEYRHAWRDRYDESDGSSDQDQGRLNEAHFYFRDVLTRGLDIQVGRQDFDEDREWLYDENLDAIRFILRRGNLRAEWFGASVLWGGDPEDEDATTFGAVLSTDVDPDWSLSAYTIRRESTLSGRRDATHLGLRGLGEFVNRHSSWGELAFLTGRDQGAELTGWAFDVGDTWSPRWADRWYLTAGWAYGSGDRGLADGRDATFRQTGLHDNNAKFGGVTSFRYYGELLDPELSNLSVATLGIGRRFGKRESLDLVFHQYYQDFARPFLVDSELGASPSGLSRDLGWELDLIFGSRSYDRMNLELVLGRFEPGDAFPDASDAWIAKIQVRTQL